MSNAIVRLLLNTADFDKGLKGSQDKLKRYEANISSAKGALIKFAGGIGMAVSAGEAFNRVMNSSQTLGDLMASSISTAKESVDQFFYSLGAGEFRHFLSGLDDIISKAREAYAAMDQLGNTRISHGYFSSKYGAQIQESQYTAKNKFAPLEARMKAFEDWRTALESQREINKTLRHDLVNAITTAVEAEIGADKIKVGFEDVEMSLAIDVLNPAKRSDLKARYARQMGAYEARRDELEKQRRGTTDKDRIRGIDSQLEDLRKIYREAIIVNAMLNKYNDDELRGIAGNAIEYQNLSSSLNSISREYNETANEFNNANKAVKGFVKVLSLEGYTTYTGTSTTTGGRTKTKKKAEFNPEITPYVNASIRYDTPLGKKVIQAMQGDGQLPIIKQPIIIEEEIDEEMPKFKDIIPRSAIDIANEYREGLNGVASAFGSIASMTDGASASALNYMSTLISSIAQAIPAISTLIAAKKAEANANTEAAATGAASSVASIPIAGPILAVAAVASVMAALMNLPKFASGGIIGGSSKMGDHMIARVNAGEMILNTTQQGKLFNMINNGTIGGNIQVGGTVTVNGSKMMLAITNEMKRTGKRFPK